MNKSVSKTLHTYILPSLPNFTIYFTRNVIFHFQLLSSTTFWLCAMSTWVVRVTLCLKFAGSRSNPAVFMERAVCLATLTTLDFCGFVSKPRCNFVSSNRPCPLLSFFFSPMVTTRKENGTQER